jgi:hypothetical protein
MGQLDGLLVAAVGFAVVLMHVDEASCAKGAPRRCSSCLMFIVSVYMFERRTNCHTTPQRVHVIIVARTPIHEFGVHHTASPANSDCQGCELVSLQAVQLHGLLYT